MNAHTARVHAGSSAAGAGAEQQRHCSSASTRRKRRRRRKPEVGDAVEVFFREYVQGDGSHWFPGQIIEKGTYVINVRFDDGETHSLPCTPNPNKWRFVEDQRSRQRR
jgi:hypothetical protein